MRDLALQAAGMLAILVAIAHGALGELRVFANAHIEPRRTRTLLHLIFQASTVDWIGIGVLLIAAPSLGSEAARHWGRCRMWICSGRECSGHARAARWMGVDELCRCAGANGPLSDALRTLRTWARSLPALLLLVDGSPR